MIHSSAFNVYMALSCYGCSNLALMILTNLHRFLAVSLHEFDIVNLKCHMQQIYVMFSMLIHLCVLLFISSCFADSFYCMLLFSDFKY